MRIQYRRITKGKVSMKNPRPHLDMSKNIEHISIKIPEHKSWNNYKDLYLELRKDTVKWSEIEKEICRTVNYLCCGNFNTNKTLNKCLPTCRRGRFLIKNILAARRIIFFQIIYCKGRLHEVETFLGYEEEKDIEYENPYRIYDIGFRKYCNTLAIKPTEFSLTGEGLLIEEEKWLFEYCKLNELFYGFPILP